MIRFYIQIGKKNNDLVKDLEIIKNDNNLIILADYFPPVNRLLVWAKKKAGISEKK